MNYFLLAFLDSQLPHFGMSRNLQCIEVEREDSGMQRQHVGVDRRPKSKIWAVLGGGRR